VRAEAEAEVEEKKNKKKKTGGGGNEKTGGRTRNDGSVLGLQRVSQRKRRNWNGKSSLF
jgi:hypothetical protein